MRSADEIDFTEFVAGSSRHLLGLAYLLTWDPQVAGDLLQVALERAYRRWPSLNREGLPEDCVREVMVKTAIKHRGRHGPSAVVELDDAQVGAPDGSDEAAARIALVGGVVAMPANQRAVLVLRYFESLGDAQAAATMGVSVGAVRNHCHRALLQLATVIAESQIGWDALSPAGLEQVLREVFDLVGTSMVAAPGLVGPVRQRVRAQRRRTSWVAAVVVLVLGVAGAVVAGSRSAKAPEAAPKLPPPRFRVEAFNVESMAIGGNQLYVAMNAYPRGQLTAYDRTTGAPLRTVGLPAGPKSVVVGSDGTVWVTFYPSNAGRRAGVAEFSADLSRRSTLLTDDRYLDADTFDVVPLGDNRALLATDHGLVTVALPRLDGRRIAEAGRGNAHLAVLPNQHVGAPTHLAALSNGNIAALLSSDGGQSRLVLRHGSAEFTGTAMTVAASPDGLWVTTGAGRRAVLRRLSTSLTPLPVGTAVRTVSLPGGADRVWTSNRTVWIATDRQRISLACFAFSSPSDEPTATVALPAADSMEATDPVVTGDLTIVPSPQAVYVASPYGIDSYPVPASCRS
jgi:DNA-directed RNA polymerase specialized sigma24 family protein